MTKAIITPTRIAEITALTEAATPRKLCVVEDEIWDVRHDGEPGVPLFRPNRDYRSWGRDVSKDEITANAAFIAAARTAVPELLAEREVMAAQNAELILALAEADRKNDALAHEWNRAEARMDVLREAASTAYNFARLFNRRTDDAWAEAEDKIFAALNEQS